MTCATIRRTLLVELIDGLLGGISISVADESVSRWPLVELEGKGDVDAEWDQSRCSSSPYDTQCVNVHLAADGCDKLSDLLLGSGEG